MDQSKKRKTILSRKIEKKIIEGNEMLIGDSVNLVISVIHEQFPRIAGLTDSSIGKC